MNRKRRIHRYKGIAVNLLGIPVDLSRDNKECPPNNIRSRYLRSFIPINTKGLPKNLLVLYDIPEDKKKERDWFRRQLRSFDFDMIQRSVWVGPSPLPKDFLAYVKTIGLQNEFKIFKLARPYKKIV
mgnify:CR=1